MSWSASRRVALPAFSSQKSRLSRTAGWVASAAHRCDHSRHVVVTGCSAMSSPASRCPNAVKMSVMQDFARCVVTGHLVHGDRQIARTALGTNDIRRGQRRVRQVLPGDELGEDSQHRVPLLRAAGRALVGKRPGRQFGELLRCARCVAPTSPRVRRSAGATRRDGWSRRSARTGRRPRPPRGRAAGSAGRTSDRLRATRARGSTRCWAEQADSPRQLARIGQPACRVSSGERGRQRGHALVLVQVLRREVQTLLGRFVATPMAITESPPSSKKLAFRSIESIPRRLRPDALQRRFDLLLPAAGRILPAPAPLARRLSPVAVGMGRSGWSTVLTCGSTQCFWRAKG